MAVLTFAAGAVIAAVSPTPAQASGTDGLTVNDPALLKSSTELLDESVAGEEPAQGETGTPQR